MNIRTVVVYVRYAVMISIRWRWAAMGSRVAGPNSFGVWTRILNIQNAVAIAIIFTLLLRDRCIGKPEQHPEVGSPWLTDKARSHCQAGLDHLRDVVVTGEEQL